MGLYFVGKLLRLRREIGVDTNWERSAVLVAIAKFED